MKLKRLVLAVLGAYSARSGTALGALALVVEKEAHGKLPESVRALYAEKEGKYHLDVDGLEDTAGLKSALAKERDEVKKVSKAMKTLQEQFEGLDPVKIREMLDKLGGDEEAQLIKAGKIDEVVNKRLEKAVAAHQKELAKAEAAVKKADERAGKFSSQVLDNHIRAAATKAGMHANAVDDALFRARTLFTLGEDGNPVQLKEGEIVFGKDGKTPFTPTEWLEGMKESAPHWFPAGAAGAGAAGSKGVAPGTKTMKRAAFDVLGADAKRDFTVVQKGVVVD